MSRYRCRVIVYVRATFYHKLMVAVVVGRHVRFFFSAKKSSPLPASFSFVFNGLSCLLGYSTFQPLWISTLQKLFERCANLHNVFQTKHESKRKPKTEEKNVKIIIHASRIEWFFLSFAVFVSSVCLLFFFFGSLSVGFHNFLFRSLHHHCHNQCYCWNISRHRAKVKQTETEKGES